MEKEEAPKRSFFPWFECYTPNAKKCNYDRLKNLNAVYEI